MEFTVMVKAEVTVSKVIIADNWEAALEKARKLTVAQVIPTPKTFVFDYFSDTELIGIFQ